MSDATWLALIRYWYVRGYKVLTEPVPDTRGGPPWWVGPIFWPIED